ncbi:MULTISPECIES: PTS sugar transporter subunit IIA [unclassified Sporolactobacillus]|uniref:PTS sugar transporter subunit IIA n=1 Tax=unclassified Sporolactobacillus TaxID=2628533 RepID=UPI002368B550|nr:PTS sugar transporter subunit IIA [Sporolactobacillus sp. CQH2019]MDD9147740.1 PTS sugar transporter subunit IIA [Sporolactobacillus sp. CQH2019]
MTEDNLTFDLFFKKDLVFLDAEWADAADFFKKIAGFLERGGYVKQTFYKAITERERNYPTGLQTASVGAAIPHADPVHIQKPFIAVIRPKQPIAFAPMGGRPDDQKIQAEIIFLLGVMRNGLQVKVLQKLMGMLSNESVIDELLHTSSDEQVLQIIKKSFAAEQAV